MSMITSDEIKNIIRDLRVRETLLPDGSLLIAGITRAQLCQVLLLAQSQALELETQLPPCNDNNPS